MLLNRCNLRRGAAALVAMLTSGASHASNSTAQLLVPAYFYPGGSDLADWDRMIRGGHPGGSQRHRQSVDRSGPRG